MPEITQTEQNRKRNGHKIIIVDILTATYGILSLQDGNGFNPVKNVLVHQRIKELVLFSKLFKI